MKLMPITLMLLMLVACHKPTTNTIAVGTMAGPETELIEVAQKIAYEKCGLSVKIIEFNDYNLPNESLQNGSIDVNVYQHLPYLLAAQKARGYHLEVIGKTFVYPMGVYSTKYKLLRQIPEHALIAIPNDPSNEARALMLLQQAGLITLSNTHFNITSKDIKKNPHHLKFRELDAAQLPRILPDVDAAIINTTFAVPAGLNPKHDALFMENENSPYANLVVMKADNNNKTQLMCFVGALNSDEVKQKAQEIFKDAAIPAWISHQTAS